MENKTKQIYIAKKHNEDGSLWAIVKADTNKTMEVISGHGNMTAQETAEMNAKLLNELVKNLEEAK